MNILRDKNVHLLCFSSGGADCEVADDVISLFNADAGVSVLLCPLLCVCALWLGGSWMLLDARRHTDARRRSSAGTKHTLCSQRPLGVWLSLSGILETSLLGVSGGWEAGPRLVPFGSPVPWEAFLHMHFIQMAL